jgi:hypothetical protein
MVTATSERGLAVDSKCQLREDDGRPYRRRETPDDVGCFEQYSVIAPGRRIGRDPDAPH